MILNLTTPGIVGMELVRHVKISYPDIKAPCSKLQGIFDCRKFCFLNIRLLTPQEAAGLAFAVAVQNVALSFLFCSLSIKV